MKIHVIAFGKLRAPGLREACDYYARNLGAWVKVEETELKPQDVPDKSPATRKQIQEKEAKAFGEKLSAALGPRGVLVLLDETGKAEPTLDWATRFERWRDGSAPEIVIGVGSSLGWSPELRKRAQALLSFGPQTLSHELARLVLYEQLYRAFSVLHGHPYHHQG